MTNKSTEIAIIGLGRFGYFWGKHLSKDYNVYGFDVDDSIKDNLESSIMWCDINECLKKEIIFLTIPIRKIEDFLIKYRENIKANAVVIDCASVKICVVEWLQKYLTPNIFFASYHPLFGPDSAKTGLIGQQISLMPGRIPYVKYQNLVNILKNLGLNIVNLTADEHDRLMAYNLSFIHHLGRTFFEMNISKVPLMMAGLQTLNSISEVVMNDSDELFKDFYDYNKYANLVKNNFIDSFAKIYPHV